MGNSLLNKKLLNWLNLKFGKSGQMSRYPELACDPDNFYLLCCSLDVEGRRSCHEIMDGGSIAEWEAKRDSVHKIGKNLKHRSELEYKPVEQT